MENAHALPSIKSLVLETWNLYKAKWKPLTLLTVIMVVVIALCVLVIAGILLAIGGTAIVSAAAGSFPSFSPAMIIGMVVVLVLGILLLLVASTAVIIAPIHVLLADRPVSVWAALKYGWSRVKSGIWVSVLTGFASMGAFLLLLIPGLWLSVAIGFSFYVFIDEDKRGLAALMRSWELVRGRWWAVLGRYLLFTLAIEIVAYVVQRIFGLAIEQLVLFLVLMPISFAFGVVLYRDLKKQPMPAPAKSSMRGWLKAFAILGIVTCLLYGMALSAIARFAVSSFTSGYESFTPGDRENFEGFNLREGDSLFGNDSYVK